MVKDPRSIELTSDLLAVLERFPADSKVFIVGPDKTLVPIFSFQVFEPANDGVKILVLIPSQKPYTG